jgi:hypothetical protein
VSAAHPVARPRLAARWPTYALLIGSVVGILAVGLAFPAVVGHSTSGPAAVAPIRTARLPPGRPADHDPRPAPEYSRLSLLTSPRPSVTLTASDVGVTPSTITLGVIVPGLGAVASFGLDVSQFDPKVQEAYWQAAIERINAAGGLDGRKLDVVYAVASILSTDSMTAACDSLTEDHHVFAVANVFGITGDPVLCVTRDHHTPYIGIDGEDPSYYQISQGRLITLEPSTTRTLSLFLSRLDQLGLLNGRRIGILHDTGPGGTDGTVLRKDLEQYGVKSVIDGPLGNEDPLIVTGEVAEAEQHMHQAGVDTVLMLTNAVYGTVFATQADQDHYTPTYLVTDLGFATAGDSFVSNMPPPFFRQALAVTTGELGQGRANIPESPLDAGCRLAYGKFAHEQVQRDSADAVAALASCAVIQILTMGLNAAGPNPTRAGFTASLADAGEFALPAFGRGYLAPGHLDAADDVEVAQAHADCQCWYAVDGYRPVSAVAGS